MATAYQKRAHQQCVEWAQGKSVHNVVDDECCPDFSCCVPECYNNDRFDRIRVANDYAKAHKLPLIPLDS